MALFRSRQRERSIYFPWERKGLLRSLQLPRRRATAWMGLVVIALFLYWSHGLAHSKKMIRITRAALARTRTAVDIYRSDHDGSCPPTLAQLTPSGNRAFYLPAIPTDGWQRPLRYRCPSEVPTRAYDLLSDGPDGEPYGLDRIE